MWLSQRAPVTYRAGDQLNNALSLNLLDPGEIAAPSGTSGVVSGIVTRYWLEKTTKGTYLKASPDLVSLLLE